MKRDKRLFPLSWGHHDLLVYADRVKMALTTDHPSYRYSMTELIEKTRSMWDSVLRDHIRAEKEILFRPLEGKILYQSELEKLETGFEEIVRLYAELSEPIPQMRNGSKLQSKDMIRLAELIVHHVRFQERELFPKIQLNLEKGLFDEVGLKLEKALPRACRVPHRRA
jgi:hypothetical protein